MKAISGLPARGVPMLPAVGACRHSRQGSLLQIPSSGGKLGSEGRSSGGCRFEEARWLPPRRRLFQFEVGRQIKQLGIKSPISAHLHDVSLYRNLFRSYDRIRLTG